MSQQPPALPTTEREALLTTATQTILSGVASYRKTHPNVHWDYDFEFSPDFLQQFETEEEEEQE